jgi:pimeloyl-ACP methyl ester carboxylesterase
MGKLRVSVRGILPYVSSTIILSLLSIPSLAHARISSIPEEKAPNLIVFVHGCCTDENDVKKLREELKIAYEVLLQEVEQWEIVAFDWHGYTPKPEILPFYSKEHADIAYGHAKYTVGKELADYIDIADNINISKDKSPYKHIHLIGHSAGAKLIHETARWLSV